MNFRRDPYPDENIFLHEFAHAIHSTGLNKIDPSFDERLKTAFSAAKDRGLWKNTYAATNRHEYWAEGVQSWFDDNAPPDALHNDVRTRDKLKDYDPGLSALCKEVFGDRPWRYLKPRDRSSKDRAIFSATIRTTCHDFAGGKRRRALARASSFRRRKETSTSNSKLHRRQRQ